MAILGRRPGRSIEPMRRATPASQSTLVTSLSNPNGQPMIAEWSAPDAVKWAYLANVYVYAAARAVAQDVASLPFRMGADPTKPNDFDVKHPLARMLGPAPGGPATSISSRTLWEWSVTQRIVTGRWAWERINDPLLGVASLWPLPASHLQPIPSSAPQEWFKSFVFGSGIKRKTLAKDQVVYGWKPSQDDFRQPESSLQAARLNISIAVMQDRYDYSFLKNDARPAAVVVHEQFDDPLQRAKFRRQFQADHRGPDNAGKMAFAQVAPGGAEAGKSLAIIPIGLSQTDAEFIARYHEEIQAILVAIGVPMTRLMDASGRTFNNAGEESRGYWNVTVKEMAQEFSEVVNTELAPIFGQSVGWFDSSKIDKLLQVPRFNPYQGAALVKAGVITRSEVRAELGLPPIEQIEGQDAVELEAVWQQALAAATSKAGGGAAALSAPQASPVVNLTLPASRDLTTLEGLLEAVLARSTEPRPLDDVIDADVIETPEDRERSERERRDAHYRAFASTIEPLERLFTRRFQKLLDAQMRSVIERLNGKRGRQATRAQPSVDKVFDADWWEKHTVEETLGLYEQVVTAGGVAAANKLGVSFDVTATYALDFIDERANKLAGAVTASTYEAIKDELVEGVAAGESIDDIADRIRGLFEQTYRHRAETVARTEVISSYNGSTALVAEEYGDLVDGLEWIASRDSRVRASHAEADGQTTDVSGSFDVGGAELAYPGDPDGPAEEIVNCRCTVAMIVAKAEKKAAASPKATVEYAAFERAALEVVRGADPVKALAAITS